MTPKNSTDVPAPRYVAHHTSGLHARPVVMDTMTGRVVAEHYSMDAAARNAKRMNALERAARATPPTGGTNTDRQEHRMTPKNSTATLVQSGRFPNVWTLHETDGVDAAVNGGRIFRDTLASSGAFAAESAVEYARRAGLHITDIDCSTEGPDSGADVIAGIELRSGAPVICARCAHAMHAVKPSGWPRVAAWTRPATCADVERGLAMLALRGRVRARRVSARPVLEDTWPNGGVVDYDPPAASA